MKQAMFETTDGLLQRLARRACHIMAEIDQLGFPQDKENYLLDEQAAIWAMLCELRAETLSDVVPQLAYAIQLADMLGDDECPNRQVQLRGYRQLSKLLYSALVAVEKADGSNRRDCGMDKYAPGELDPEIYCASG